MGTMKTNWLAILTKQQKLMKNYNLMQPQFLKKTCLTKNL